MPAVARSAAECVAGSRFSKSSASPSPPKSPTRAPRTRLSLRFGLLGASGTTAGSATLMLLARMASSVRAFSYWLRSVA